MQKIFLFLSVQLIAMATLAQNIGIGTTTPTTPLTVAAVSHKGFMQVDGSVGIGFVTYNEANPSNSAAYLNTFGNFPMRFSINSGAAVMSITPNGQVGIGTTNPTARLEVIGDMKVGQLSLTNGLLINSFVGNTINALQFGTTAIGSSAASTKTVTITFPKAFLNVPQFIPTVRHDFNFNVSDVFALTVKSITTTQAVIIVKRIDVDAAWSQNLRIDYIALSQ